MRDGQENQIKEGEQAKPLVGNTTVLHRQKLIPRDLQVKVGRNNLIGI